MKRTVLLAFLLSTIFTWRIEAQISFDYDTLTTEVVDGVTDIVGYNMVHNNLPQLKNFRWTRNQVDLPDGWNTAVCDVNACYLKTTDTEVFSLGPQTAGRLDVHLYPDNDIWDGAALIEVLIEDESNSSNSATVVYMFDSEYTNTGEAQQLNFKVYPNPTSGLFTLEGETAKAASISILNMMGQRLIETPIQGGDWYNVSKLTPGIYLLQLTAEDGRPLGTKMITKY